MLCAKDDGRCVGDIEAPMIFEAVNRPFDIEIVERKHHRIAANTADVGAGVGHAVLEPAIRQIKLHADVADKLPVL